jgi:hypothetical protein
MTYLLVLLLPLTGILAAWAVRKYKADDPREGMEDYFNNFS